MQQILETPVIRSETDSAVSDQITVCITGIYRIADRTNVYELASADGGELPACEPGAHITLLLPNGLSRQYSVMNPGNHIRAYEIAVKLDENSRGGSDYLHNETRVGQLIQIRPPLNNFPLEEGVERSVLIAGGIGVTPIWAMWNRLKKNGEEVSLFYASRSEKEALFLDAFRDEQDVIVYFDSSSDCSSMNLKAIVDSEDPARDTHIYCCGPERMLDEFLEITRHWPAEKVHVEYFAAGQIDPDADNSGFTVELRRSGKTIQVLEGQTILDAMKEHDIDTFSDCKEGICGACITKVLEGEPDHRDFVLTQAQKDSNKLVMICCSRSKSSKLVLDI